jgi:hypothetical protein
MASIRPNVAGRYTCIDPHSSQCYCLAMREMSRDPCIAFEMNVTLCSSCTRSQFKDYQDGLPMWRMNCECNRCQLMRACKICMANLHDDELEVSSD